MTSSYHCDNDFDDDDRDNPPCPACDGLRTVECYCCGDFCCCASQGEKDCSFCHGEGEVTEQRYQLYLDRMKERARVWEEARKKAEESQ
jgi:hypothetical protein